jgi:hypothetical protein
MRAPENEIDPLLHPRYATSAVREYVVSRQRISTSQR